MGKHRRRHQREEVPPAGTGRITFTSREATPAELAKMEQQEQERATREKQYQERLERMNTALRASAVAILVEGNNLQVAVGDNPVKSGVQDIDLGDAGKLTLSSLMPDTVRIDLRSKMPRHELPRKLELSGPASTKIISLRKFSGDSSVDTQEGEEVYMDTFRWLHAMWRGRLNLVFTR